MGREPRSQQRPVALTGVDVDSAIDVFSVTVDDVFDENSHFLSAIFE